MKDPGPVRLTANRMCRMIVENRLGRAFYGRIELEPSAGPETSEGEYVMEGGAMEFRFLPAGEIRIVATELNLDGSVARGHRGRLVLEPDTIGRFVLTE